jgi:hypothetical protein
MGRVITIPTHTTILKLDLNKQALQEHTRICIIASITIHNPQAALDLMDIARANQLLYNYDSSDWEYWANLYLNAPYY